MNSARPKVAPATPSGPPWVIIAGGSGKRSLHGSFRTSVRWPPSQDWYSAIAAASL
ncbi:MAG: hypothetical protein HRF50_17365 [Phycisphaerae bacterium]|jgi:hypothetical protein